MTQEVILPPGARPAIYVDGSFSGDLTDDLVELLIEEEINRPARCLAKFTNLDQDSGGGDYKYFDRTEVDFGRSFTVQLVVLPSSMRPIFEGTVNLIEGVFERGARPHVLVQSEDGLHRLKQVTRTRTFEDVSDSDVIQQIASDHGWSTELDIEGPEHRSLSQLSQSDWDFLLERVRSTGGRLSIEGSTLHVRQQVTDGADPVQLILGEHFHDFSVKADVRDQSTHLGVSGWDVQSKEAIAQSADTGDLPSFGGTSGGQILASSWGDVSAIDVDRVPESSDEAEQLAQRRYRDRSFGFVSGVLLRPDGLAVRAGSSVQILEAGELFSGLYRVCALRHRFSPANGWSTELAVESSEVGQP